MNVFHLELFAESDKKFCPENPGTAEQSFKDNREQYLAARPSSRMLLLLWTWAILHLATAHENITCFQDGQECELSDQNLVETAIVTNWQECSLLCLNSTECYAFTFFGQNSDFLPHNSCLLFSSCRTKLPCNDCVIGKPQVKALES